MPPVSLRAAPRARRRLRSLRRATRLRGRKRHRHPRAPGLRRAPPGTSALRPRPPRLRLRAHPAPRPDRTPYLDFDSCRTRSRSRTMSPPSSRRWATACSTACAIASAARFACAATSSRSKATSRASSKCGPWWTSSSSWSRGGHEIGPSTVDAVLGALDQVEDVRQVSKTLSGAIAARRSLRRPSTRSATSTRSVTAPSRSRSARPEPARRTWRWRSRSQPWRTSRSAASSSAPCRRGRRASRLPSGHAAGEGRPLPATALRRSLRHAGRRPPQASCMEKGIVEVAPLAFMRGRTLNDSFVILDEAQNTSPSRCRCSRRGLASVRRWSSPGT